MSEPLNTLKKQVGLQKKHENCCLKLQSRRELFDSRTFEGR